MTHHDNKSKTEIASEILEALLETLGKYRVKVNLKVHRDEKGVSKILTEIGVEKK